jgi:hypothetical protein
MEARMLKSKAGLSAALIAACSSMLWSGCMAPTIHRQYSGKNLPPGDVARIVIRNGPIYTSKIGGADIRVDQGRLLKETLLRGGMMHYALNAWPKRVEVLPGEQELEVNFSISTGSQVIGNRIVYQGLHSTHPRHLAFKAEAGHEYQVNGEQIGMNWSARLEEISDKETHVVATAKPEDPKGSFEEALQKAMFDGDVSADSVTITYPDGSSKTVPNPNK